MPQSPTSESSFDDISDQVKLPLRVAFQVVVQGMKIRLGRALVTIMGVVLGIAFLMSILTTQVLKKGVVDEQKARLEIQRMTNFLKAEIGPLTGKSIAVLQTSSLDDMEKRFVHHLAAQKIQALNWCRLASVSGPDAAEFAAVNKGILQETDLGKLAAGNQFILLLGDGPVPDGLWNTVFQETAAPRLGITRPDGERQVPDEVRATRLSRMPRPEEIAKQAAEKRLNQYRSIWIIVISLLVTVIGISNAMLMSVTERFREIGTMKCLGALSAFVRQIFLIESCMIGAMGGLAGSILGAGFTIIIYAFTFGLGMVTTSLSAAMGTLFLYLLLAFTAGVVLSMMAAIYPANVASKMVPANALRSNI